MNSLAAALLDRGLVSLDALDAALARQMVNGGDLATNLVGLGAMKENALQRALAELHELPVGPKGPLPAPPNDVFAIVSRETMRRLRVLPFKRGPRTLHFAVDAPLAPAIEAELKMLVELELRPVLVTTLRLDEALHVHCDEPLPAPTGRVVDALAAAVHVPEPKGSGAGAYRRMSESPGGVRISQKQAVPIHEPLSEPAYTEGPAPDSQGHWLDEVVDGRDDSVADVPSGPPTSRSPGRLTPIVLPNARPTLAMTALPAESEAPSDPTDSYRAVAPSRPSVPHALPSEPARGPAPSVRSTLPPTARAAVPSSTGKSPFMATIPAMGAPLPSEPVPLPPPSSRGDDAAYAAAALELASSARLSAMRHKGPLDLSDALALAREAEDVEAVLRIVARYAKQYFERLLVFVVQGESADLRLALGLGGRQPSLLVELTGPSLLRRAVIAGAPVLGELGREGADAELRACLGADVPMDAAAVVPMTIRGRAIVLLYGDDLDEPVAPAAVAAVQAFAELGANEMARVVLARKVRVSES